VTAATCPYPNTCPVPDPVRAVLRRVRTHTIDAGVELFRSHKAAYPADDLVPGIGDSRFAPLDGVSHAYVSRRATPALLESAFRDATPPQPRIYPHRLAAWSLSRVRLAVDLRLIDLRDPELARLGIDRSQLVTTLPAHYPCTRDWAVALHDRHVGGQPTHGLLWNSRQAELHAAADHNPLTVDLLGSGETTEVAVLYVPPSPRQLLEDTGRGPGSLAHGEGERFAMAVGNLIGAALYPPAL
jgi:hypothetical protein